MPLFGGPPNVDRLEARRDVAGLIKALGYQKDPNVRRLAARALGKIGDPAAVEPLVASLGDQDWSMRQTAAMALGEIGNARAVGPLIAALDDGGTRWFAVTSLGEIGDPAAVEPILATLDDSDDDVRKAAVRSLGNFRDARVVEPLVAVLRGTDRDLRTEAIKALDLLDQLGDARVIAALIALLRDESTVRDPRTAPAGSFAPREALGKAGVPAVEPLIVALADASVLVRRAAAAILGWIRDHRAIAPLLAALEDENPLVRVAAANALDALGWSPAGPSMAVARWLAKGEWQECVKIGTDAVEPLTAALGDPNTWVREAAIKALGEIADQRAVEPLAGLLSDQSEDLRVREAAAEALGVIGDPVAVEPLLAVLAWASTDRDSEGFLRHEDEALHTAVASALGKIGDPALGPLMDALRGWDRGQRLRAVGALDELGWQPDNTEIGACYWAAKRRWDKCEAADNALVQVGEVAVKPLIAVLPHSTAAARILGRIGDKRAAMPLIKVLPRPSATTKNWASIAALGDLGDDRAVLPLIDILRGDDMADMAAAAKSLSQIGDARAVEPLLAVLADQTHEDFVRWRWAVIGALGNLGDKRAVEPLSALLNDPNRGTSEFQAIATALDKLGVPSDQWLVTGMPRSAGSPPGLD